MGGSRQTTKLLGDHTKPAYIILHVTALPFIQLAFKKYWFVPKKVQYVGKGLLKGRNTQGSNWHLKENLEGANVDTKNYTSLAENFPNHCPGTSMQISQNQVKKVFIYLWLGQWLKVWRPLGQQGI